MLQSISEVACTLISSDRQMKTSPSYIRQRFIEPLTEWNRDAAQRHVFKFVEEGCEQGIAVTLGWMRRKEEAELLGVQFTEPAPTAASVSALYPVQLPNRPTGAPILPSDYLRLKYVEPLKYRAAVRDLCNKDKIREIGRAEGIVEVLDWMLRKEKAKRESMPFTQPIPNPKSATAKCQLRYAQYTRKGNPARFILPIAYIYYKFIDPSFQRWRAEGYARGICLRRNTRLSLVCCRYKAHKPPFTP